MIELLIKRKMKRIKNRNNNKERLQVRVRRQRKKLLLQQLKIQWLIHKPLVYPRKGQNKNFKK
jgi:hypothetical protein